MTPRQRREAELYVAWLRSGRDLSPSVPLRANLATFLEQLMDPRPGRKAAVTVLQRYEERQRKLFWIARVKNTQVETERAGVHDPFQEALRRVAAEAGAPARGTLRNWVRHGAGAKVGSSVFLPMLDDGTPNSDPPQI